MGALTNKPMAFNSRNWEYNTQVTKDLTDFLSPRIRVDQFSGKIYRILPTVEWISNKIRFLYLGLKNQRIVTTLSTYKISVNFNFNKQIINFEKKVLITTNFKKLFFFLNSRLLNKNKKFVNLVLGNVFNSNINVFSNFENKNTKVNKFFELDAINSVNKFPESLDYNNCILFGVNPRMESPLFNLKLKDKFSEVYSLGNFSFSFPVKVLSNNFSAIVGKSFNKNTLAIFGLSSLQLYNYFNDNSKMLLLPLYYFNNLINFSVNKNKKVKTDFDDLNIYIAPQNLIKNNNNSLNVIITSHFEKLEGISGQNIRIPINSYLESSLSFFNKDLKLEKLNSLKPSFSVVDFFDAFTLFSLTKNNKLNNLVSFKGNVISNISKKKIYNKIISNSIPNYLLRDPLSRANPIFNKA